MTLARVGTEHNKTLAVKFACQLLHKSMLWYYLMLQNKFPKVLYTVTF